MRRLSQGIVLSIMISAVGCSSTPTHPDHRPHVEPVQDMLQFDREDLTPEQNFWMDEINRFHKADLSTVVYPHAEIVNQLNDMPEERYCSAEHRNLIDRALALNSTSLLALTFQAHCAYRVGDEKAMNQAQQALNGVAELLIHTGTGESPYDPIEIRDIYEAQLIFQWAGIDVFSSEVVLLNDALVYRLHSLDGETGEYRVYYASNANYVAKNLNQSVTQQELSDVLLETLIASNALPAKIWQFQQWLRNDKPDNVIAALENSEELSALESVAIAQAYFHQQDFSSFERQIDELLTYSEGGFVEASAVVGVYLMSRSEPTEMQNAVNLFAVNVDQLGEYQTVRIWLEAFLRQPEPVKYFEQFIAQLDDQHYSQWRLNIFKYPLRYGGITPIIHNKLTGLLLSLAKRYPQAQLDYSYLLLEGLWGIQQSQSQGMKIVQQLAESGFHPAQLEYGLYYSVGKYGLQENRQLAFYWYQQAANQDNVSALYNVALGHRYARGTTKNLDAAIENFQRAWDSGFGLAGCRLGDIYSEEPDRLDYAAATRIYQQVIEDPNSTGQDIAVCAYGLGFIEVHEFQRYELGIELLQRAGQLNEKNALFELGLIYADGVGVQQDPQQAIEYYQQAINLGSYRAAANLGFMYESGDGVPANNQLAIKYYKMSAQGGSATGQNNYATFLRFGTEVDKDPLAAKQLYLKAIEQRSKHAANNLADMYYYGELGEPDYTKACDYYEQAFNWQEEDALYDLAYCYLHGEGREKDTEKALAMLQQSSEMDNQDAMVELGDIYANGEIVDADVNLALSYYLRAYKQQNPQAAFALGYLYENAQAIGIDPVMARLYYEQSAKWGWVKGMLATARAYLTGYGTRKDKQTAIYWLQQASQQGSQEALSMLDNVD